MALVVNVFFYIEEFLIVGLRSSISFLVLFLQYIQPQGYQAKRHLTLQKQFFKLGALGTLGRESYNNKVLSSYLIDLELTLHEGAIFLREFSVKFFVKVFENICTVCSPIPFDNSF